MRTVAVLAVEDVIVFDLATPVEVFGRAQLPDGSPAYRVIVCGRPTSAGPLSITPGAGFDGVLGADIVVVPGSNALAPQPRAVLDAIRGARRGGARIASICVGAFILAEAGVLDGGVATTHWAAAEVFRTMHPQVRLEPEAMSCESDGVFTSAGAAAGIDLCLELVRLDYGLEIAADAARRSVMPLRRDGGQAPYLDPQRSATGGDLGRLAAWVDDRLDQHLTLDEMAAWLNVSLRTLNRRFHATFGCSPVAWLTERRVRRAQQLLVASDEAVEQIARRVGFGSVVAFRAQFRGIVGVSPSRYRGSFVEEQSAT
jgi:transcriptional regulator GlxA family with amidase domain